MRGLEYISIYSFKYLKADKSSHCRHWILDWINNNREKDADDAEITIKLNLWKAFVAIYQIESHMYKHKHFFALDLFEFNVDLRLSFP